MNRSFVVALLLGALALAPGFAGAQEDSASLEELMAGMADSKAEHQALANYYEQEAAKSRSLARHHQAMGRSYLSSRSGNKLPFSSHCKKIAEQQEAMATEFDALAKLHEGEAKTAK